MFIIRAALQFLSVWQSSILNHKDAWKLIPNCALGHYIQIGAIKSNDCLAFATGLDVPQHRYLER